MFKHGLCCEDNLCFWAAKVKETPIHALINAGVVCDRGSGYASEATFTEATFTSRPPRLTRSSWWRVPVTVRKLPWVRLEMVSVRVKLHRRFAVFGVYFSRCRVYQLHNPRFVTQDDKLHAFLVADCFHPAGDFYVGIFWQGRQGRLSGFLAQPNSTSPSKALAPVDHRMAIVPADLLTLFDTGKFITQIASCMAG